MHSLWLILLISGVLALCLVEEALFVGIITGETPASLAMAPSLSSALRRGRGRPRKFAAPSRAVTLTLPETVIERLSAIHEDLSRAVVGLAERRARGSKRQAAELLVFGRRAVITIRPTPSLERRAGVKLVPLPDGRALISFDMPQSLAELELTINDALDDASLSREDRAVYEGIGAILKEARRSKTVSLHRRNIIVLESTRRGRSSPSESRT
jgi:hypothetical protein